MGGAYLLTKLGYTDPNECWMALKAMYGLRQSPKTWGDYRDSTLSTVSWTEEEEVEFRPLISDPNVWKIIVKKDDLGRSGGGDERNDVGLC